jgi:hypothetical protein
MIVVGFTGTQKGMTDAQKVQVGLMLADTKIRLAHHGDCIGADDDFDLLCSVHGIRRHHHPCDIVEKRAHCAAKKRAGVEVVYAPRPPLKRNHGIVALSDILLATPGGFEEELRSGTWATIRHARKRGMLVLIVWPDGLVSEMPFTS